MVRQPCRICAGEKEKGQHFYCLKCEADLSTLPARIRCKRCKKVKPNTGFSMDKSRITGHFPWCKNCQTNYSTTKKFQDDGGLLTGVLCPMDDTPIRGHKNRQFCSNSCRDRAKALRDKYNLSPEQYRVMVDAMGGLCPICKKHSTSWQVDHNHDSMRVMGVVCVACNVGALANTYHSVDMVRRLLSFLESPPSLVLGIDVLANETREPPHLHKRWGWKNKALQQAKIEGIAK